ncbi:hypothetical protein BU23DRAFT_513743 [Bimuria novae-zelandiae CBS 107.79]|uniref:Integral membrane protein n=1 Tax=Bimuria novae-zelandiae CBS 107.79 TaxID=1447943 RepID=A0A6A5UX12_9PLEO|nr:hypothetical protein BU23DRAFT_513743 [Bimuria novae-zelandiae CBS 107.79]
MSDREGGARPATTTVSSTTTTHGPTITTTTYTFNGPQTIVTTSAPHATTIVSPTVTTTHQTPIPQRPHSSVASQTAQHASIRIRRAGATQSREGHAEEDEAYGNRRRSFSEPERPQPALLKETEDLEIRRHLSASPLQTLHEERSGYSVPQVGYYTTPVVPERSPQRPTYARQGSAINLRHSRNLPAGEYEADVVDVLDVIDPEVATLTTLNNVQNSLFIPNFGRFYDRRPTYELSQSESTSDEELADGVEQQDDKLGRVVEKTHEDSAGHLRLPEGALLSRQNTISSVLTGVSEGHNYAVLPHGASLPGWTAEEKALLNDRVRHMLHSRRAGFRRSMRGFGRYVRKPVGFLISLYAFLLTFWGAAWVLFLIGWISVEGRQGYFIEICDQILTALFCVVGIGMAPWRAIDTYHMIFVAKYAHKTWRVRRERGLPPLRDPNELPTLPQTHSWETGEDQNDPVEEPVLKSAEQEKLEYHQNKLAKSHTFYKPRETNTHHAFSVRLLIAIVVLLDCHSLFQMALGGTTWGIYWKVRPKALTAVILTCSITCNISAGITISLGDRRSRKKIVVEQMFRQGLTEQALHELRKERGLVASGVGRRVSKKGKKRET